LLATGVVLIKNVAAVVPEATVTLAGTVATELSLELSVTSAPFAGAGPFSVTVPVEELPPRTDVGLTVTELRVAAVTVSVAAFVTFAYEAVMLTEVFVATGEVVTRNVAVVAFAGMMTLVGTLPTALLLLARAICAPAAGAGPFSVTVPVDDAPPRTEVGLNVTELSAAAVTVNDTELELLVYDAEILTELVVATGEVVTVKVAEVAFAGTVMLAGTTAIVPLLLLSTTAAPDEGAGPLRVTVPVDELPPSTEVGLKVTELTRTELATEKLMRKSSGSALPAVS
jgi:hypothetical protein